MSEGWMWLDGANRWHWIKPDHRSLCGKIACLGPVEGETTNTETVMQCSACRKRLERRKEKAFTSCE